MKFPLILIFPVFLSLLSVAPGYNPIENKSGGNFPIDEWDLLAIHTARDANYLSETEKEIVLEINKARTNPSLFAEKYLVPMRTYYNGKRLERPGRIALITSEGVKALDECIREMKKIGPVPMLYPAQGLCRAASDLARDQGKTGKLGHAGGDGSSPAQRISRYGKWLKTIGENIDYGNAEARDIVISLLIDDGVSSRGHRKNLLNESFGVIGVALGEHPEYTHMCVMDFAGGFE